MILPSCQQLIDFLDDYVDHRLPAIQRLAFDAHLAVCRDCRNYLASYRQTIALSGDLAAGSESAGTVMPPEMMRAILDSMMREAGDKTG